MRNMCETMYLTAKDGKEVFVRMWKVTEPKATVQIIHGMNEHSGRYQEFAEFLNNAGFSVFATDHRGHGKTAKSPERVGYIDEAGFPAMVADEYQLLGQIQKIYPDGLPHFVLGHSMGSFITQRFIQLHGNAITGTILMGSCGYNGVVRLGKPVAKLVEKITGDARSEFLEKIIFSGYNHRTEKRTKYDWLASDPQVITTFMEDPYCAKTFPPSFYRHFLQWLQDIFVKEEVAKIPRELPLLLVAGKEDPVGLFGKGMEILAKQYQKHDTEQPTHIHYPKNRHKIIKKKKKAQVFQDILDWIATHLTRK